MSPRKAAKQSTLPTREQILDYLRDAPGKQGKREIARAFKVGAADRIALKRLLKEMAEDGLLEKRGRKVARTGHLAPVEVLEITGRDTDGELLASPSDWDVEANGAPPVVVIEPERGRKARLPAPGVGDTALIRITANDEPGGPAYTGRVIRVLSARPKRIIGVFEATADGGGLVHSADKKDRRDYTIAPHARNDAEDGELVAVELVRGPRIGPPRAKVVERIGDMKSEKAVSLIAILSHGIPDEFSPEILAEADGAEAATMTGREDLRRLPLITIDPADAKDHDDAVHAAPDEDPENPGGFVLTVAIADVAFHVRSGSALDRSARERGNSVYFPDRVVPMLPEKLSADLCSLRAGKDRPAMVVEMIIDADGRKRRHRFFRAMIRIAAGLSYNQAQDAVNGRPEAEAKPLVESVLKPLWATYEALARARDAREPLDLDIPERKLILDQTGHVEKVIVPERLEAHRLIEAFMILANVAAAETLEAKKTPLLYRIHDAPSPEKLAAFGDFLSTIGMKLAKSGVVLPAMFNGILSRVRGSEHERIVNEVVLRSQAQAEYSPENFGHFGLNLRRYAHFTSPIRRYSDLIVHRALVRALDLGEDGLSDRTIEHLDEIAAHISATERRAMVAERETVDRLIANFLADRIGAVFKGRVAGVTRSGMFVKLDDTGADGFIPAATIGSDYFRHDEAAQALVGDRTGETYRLGDQVEVRLVEAVPLAGALRFEVLSEGHYVSKQAPAKRAPRNPARRGRQKRGAAR